MNNRPLSREEMAELLACVGGMMTSVAMPDEKRFKYYLEQGIAILTPPDLMTETLCAERLAKNNPFTGME